MLCHYGGVIVPDMNNSILRVRLFPGKWFPRNHFPNFPVFVCY